MSMAPEPQLPQVYWHQDLCSVYLRLDVPAADPKLLNVTVGDDSGSRQYLRVEVTTSTTPPRRFVAEMRLARPVDSVTRGQVDPLCVRLKIRKFFPELTPEQEAAARDEFVDMETKDMDGEDDEHWWKSLLESPRDGRNWVHFNHADQVDYKDLLIKQLQHVPDSALARLYSKAGQELSEQTAADVWTESLDESEDSDDDSDGA